MTTRKQGAGRVYQEIMLAFAALVVPLFVLMGVLLGLVLSNRVQQSVSTGIFATAEAQHTSSGYLVDYDANKITTVASWASTTATLLPPLIMYLFSYRVAAQFEKFGRQQNSSKLPTPAQFSLLLLFLQGGPGSLWNGLMYSSWKRREKSVPMLTAAFWLFILSSSLRYDLLC
jgi:hypothetical protein